MHTSKRHENIFSCPLIIYHLWAVARPKYATAGFGVDRLGDVEYYRLNC